MAPLFIVAYALFIYAAARLMVKNKSKKFFVAGAVFRHKCASFLYIQIRYIQWADRHIDRRQHEHTDTFPAGVFILYVQEHKLSYRC